MTTVWIDDAENADWPKQTDDTLAGLLAAKTAGADPDFIQGEDGRFQGSRPKGDKPDALAPPQRPSGVKGQVTPEQRDEALRFGKEVIEPKIDEAKNAGLETEKQFEDGKFGPDGQYSPEREAMHREIVEAIWARQNADQIPNDGKAIVMGGLPGSGKSTALDSPELGISRSDYLTVNPDEFKEELAARGLVPDVAGLKPMECSALIHEESGHIAKMLADKAQAEGKNLIWDITLGSEKSYAERVAPLRDDHGPKYDDVKMIFVDVPIATSEDRAVDRYVRASDSDLGGRWVPREYIAKAADPEWGSQNRAVFERTKDDASSWQLWDGVTRKMLEQGP